MAPAVPRLRILSGVSPAATAVLVAQSSFFLSLAFHPSIQQQQQNNNNNNKNKNDTIHYRTLHLLHG
jgi:hypothetical protein